MDANSAKICIFGCGNMGSAMLRGWIAGGAAPDRFHVIDPSAQGLPDGVLLSRSAQDVDTRFDVLVLGIKPQMLSSLAPEIGNLLAPQATLLSILAGIRTDRLAAHFPSARIMRVMPNLAASLGKSPLGIFAPSTDNAPRADIAALLSPLGTAVWIDDENHMDAVTALAGSGPAFVYRFIDALAQGGVAAGLPKDVAALLALSMVEGAAILAATSDETPETLAARVTSPGGTTAAGLAVLDHADALNLLVAETLKAARDRGAELAEGN
nr:pyrroline-5-carboxylate reductase [uncultured Sphingorhabdus sp.]